MPPGTQGMRQRPTLRALKAPNLVPRAKSVPSSPLAKRVPRVTRRLQRGTLLHGLEEMGAGCVQTWPKWARDNLLKQGTLGVDTRFATTLFLLGNGVLPRAIAAYLSGAGLLADRRARAHIWDIMRDFRDGKLRLDARYWGLREGAVVCVSDSMWAHGVPRDIRGCEIWEPARDLLME